jgi:ATP-dependent metalloprotease FtsH
MCVGPIFSKPFVGLGSDMVKNLFNSARMHKPSIIFIDEIDAVASKRSYNVNTNNESSTILNTLLTEMDGFNSIDGIIVMAATNRIKVLDPAILRPGRFDRIIQFGIPTKDERQDIIKKYLKKISINEKDLKKIEDYVLIETPGFTGADVSNVINESCIIAARENKNNVSIDSFEKGIDYVLYGKSKKSGYLTKEEEYLIAVHEAGHAIIGMLLKESTEVRKVTIIPRTKGMLGFTQHYPEENKKLYSKNEMLADIMVLMGGRVGEELVLGKGNITTGAGNDIEVMNDIAFKMIKDVGMDDEIGLFSHPNDELTDDISFRVKELLSICYEKTTNLLKSNKKIHKKLVDLLIKKKTIYINPSEFKINKISVNDLKLFNDNSNKKHSK